MTSRPASKAPSRRMPQWDEQRITRFRRAILSGVEGPLLAERFGISPGSVWEYAKKFGIPEEEWKGKTR